MSRRAMRGGRVPFGGRRGHVRGVPVGGAAALVAVVWAVVLLAPLWSPCEPYAISAGVWQSGSEAGLLGTDSLGRDVACRTLLGGWRLSLSALVAAVVASALGALAGLTAGWFAEHRVAGFVSWLADVALVIPAIVVALAAATALPSAAAVLIATVATGAPLTLRIVMDVTAGSRQSGYVRAARLRRDRTMSIVLADVVPAHARTVGGDMAHRTVLALQLGAALHVLGFGPDPPDADWGTMIIENLPGLSLNPAAVVAPALALAFIAATVGLLAHFMTDGASPQ